MKKDKKERKLNFKKLRISKLNNPRIIVGGGLAFIDDDDNSGQNTQTPSNNIC